MYIRFWLMARTEPVVAAGSGSALATFSAGGRRSVDCRATRVLAEADAVED